MGSKNSIEIKVIAILALVALVPLGECQIGECFNEDTLPMPAINFTGPESFGLRIFSKIALLPDVESLIMSPFSVWSAFGTALMGAEGNTRSQLERVLGAGRTKTDAYNAMNTLNFLLNFKQGSEMKQIDKAFFSDTLSIRECVLNILPNVEILNFESAAAAGKINEEVSNFTNGKIPSILDSGSLQNSLFALISAVYFKGPWKHPFAPDNSYQDAFLDSCGREVDTVTMMTQITNLKYANRPDLGFAAVDLPFSQELMSMMILLPNENVTLDAVLGSLNFRMLIQLKKDMKVTNVALTLPRFSQKSELSTNLKDAMISFGVRDVFLASRANFTGFVADPQIHVESVVQKASIDVTEEGAEAAAVTSLVGVRFKPDNMVTFFCNRPFAYLLYHRTTQITMFAGVYKNRRSECSP